MSNTSENDLKPEIENLKERFNNCVADINYIKRGINIMTDDDYPSNCENIKDIRFKGDVTVTKGDDNVAEIQISGGGGGGGADLQDVVIENGNDIKNVGRLTCNNITVSDHVNTSRLDVINCGMRILHPDTAEGLVINSDEDIIPLQEKRIRSHHIANLNNNLQSTIHKYSEGRVSGFNQVSAALVNVNATSGIYYDIAGDYFELRRNDNTQYAVYKEFEKIASETDHLDSVYMAVDISGFPEAGENGICEIFFGQQSTRGSENGTLVDDTSFEITKPITRNGRHTFHSNFPDNISNIGAQVWSSVLHLGIRVIADDPNVVIRITGAYIETELKFGEGIRGVSFSPEGGAQVPNRTTPVTDGHQYPYHDFPVRTTDAIKKAYESGFNLCKTYNMPSNPNTGTNTGTEPIGTSIISTDVNSPGLLLQIKNFNDSLPLNQQHRRMRLSLGMEHNVYTDAISPTTTDNGTLTQNNPPVNRNRMLEVAYAAVRDYDFIHSIYLGNERVSPYSSGGLSFYSNADEFKNSWSPTNDTHLNNLQPQMSAVWNQGDAIRAAIITYLRPMIKHFRDTYCTTFPHNHPTFGQHGKRCVLTYGFEATAVLSHQDYVKDLYGRDSGHPHPRTPAFDTNDEIGLDFISANLYGGYRDNKTNTLYDPVTYMGDGKPGPYTGRGTTGIIDDFEHMQYHFSANNGPFKNKIVISEIGFQNNNEQGSGRKIGNQEWQQRFFDIFSRFMYTKTYKGVTFAHHFLYGSWFALTNESWKGAEGDNHWGIFSEGDSNSIGHRRIITDNWFINKSDNFVKIPFVDSDGNALTPNTTYEITTGPATSINNISFVKKQPEYILSAYKSGDQGISSSSVTILKGFQVAAQKNTSFNVGDVLASSAEDFVWQCPANGLYHIIIDAMLDKESEGNTLERVVVRINVGSDTIRQADMYSHAGGNDDFRTISINCSTIRDLSINDQISFGVYVVMSVDGTGTLKGRDTTLNRDKSVVHIIRLG